MPPVPRSNLSIITTFSQDPGQEWRAPRDEWRAPRDPTPCFRSVFSPATVNSIPPVPPLSYFDIDSPFSPATCTGVNTSLATRTRDENPPRYSTLEADDPPAYWDVEGAIQDAEHSWPWTPRYRRASSPPSTSLGLLASVSNYSPAAESPTMPDAATQPVSPSPLDESSVYDIMDIDVPSRRHSCVPPTKRHSHSNDSESGNAMYHHPSSTPKNHTIAHPHHPISHLSPTMRFRTCPTPTLSPALSPRWMFPRTPPKPPSPTRAQAARRSYKRIGWSEMRSSPMASQEQKNMVRECKIGRNAKERGGVMEDRLVSAEKMRRFSLWNVSMCVHRRAKSVSCSGSSAALLLEWKREGRTAEVK